MSCLTCLGGNWMSFSSFSVLNSLTQGEIISPSTVFKAEEWAGMTSNRVESFLSHWLLMQWSARHGKCSTLNTSRKRCRLLQRVHMLREDLLTATHGHVEFLQIWAQCTTFRYLGCSFKSSLNHFVSISSRLCSGN